LKNNNSYDNADVIEDNFEDYSEKNSDLNLPPNKKFLGKPTVPM